MFYKKALRQKAILDGMTGHWCILWCPHHIYVGTEVNRRGT